MNLAIIADDLTGANDSGVQLAKYGLQTSVFFKMDQRNLQDNDAIVFDTDSRAMAAEEAKHVVADVTQFLLKEGVKNIYKKIDSTMRGSIGAELVGMQQELQADFMIISPGYPKNHRQVIDGYHYLKGKKLADTEIALDPVTPVHESYLPDLLKEQIGEQVGLMKLQELRSAESFHEKLKFFKSNGISYVVVDAEVEEDLQILLSELKKTSFSTGLVGSAGLANYLPQYYDLKSKVQNYQIADTNKPILTVVGSVNINSRNQLNKLLEEEIFAVRIDSFKAVGKLEDRTDEIERVYREVQQVAKNGRDVVVYSSGEREDIELARKVGAQNGLDFTQTSKAIVSMIGELTARLLQEGLFQGIVMTGGDTAKKICEQWNIAGFTLYDELEVGVPISSFIGVDGLYAITKAGGFGKERVFIDSIAKLKGVHDSE